MSTVTRKEFDELEDRVSDTERNINVINKYITFNEDKHKFTDKRFNLLFGFWGVLLPLVVGLIVTFIQ